MSDAWLAALEASTLAGMLHGSMWAYPLVNAGHILGVALLVGGIAPLDLRLLGVWSSVPLEPLWRVQTRAAGTGFVLTVICGTLLFITRATAYADSPVFIAKMIIVAIGILNVLVLRVVMPRDRFPTQSKITRMPLRVRLAAGISLGTWLTALLLGRLVGYF